MQKTALCNRNAVAFFDAVTFSGLSRESSPQHKRLFTKMLLIMRLTTLFLVLGLLNANANGFSQMITYSGKDVAITKLFTVIEKQTGYTVFANKGLLRDTKPVNVSVTSAPLGHFLELIFKDQPVGYEINDKTIFIKEKAAIPRAVTNIIQPAPVEQPPAQVTGIVTGADKTPLAGASVYIKGVAGSGTVTKENGQFVINAEANQVLVVSYIGYVTQEIPVNGRTHITVVLKVAEKEIDAVVVTALGIKKQARAVAYNVQEVSGDDVNKVKDANFVNGLVGKVAGATINSSSAGVGSSTRVVLRGIKSISGNNNALYVIDGIPMPNTIRGQAADIYSGAGQTGDFISNLNPDDIESISILSGPSAAALYGSAAANGVVMITTKKGQKNRTDISVTNATMFFNPLILPKFQNTYGQSDIGSYYSWGDKLKTPSSYRPADFFQTGMNNSTAVTLSTGSEKSQTYVSFGNVSANGIIPNNNYSRVNFTARNSASLLDGKMTLDLGFMASLVSEQNMISQGQYFNPLVAVYLFPPGDDFNRVKAYQRYNAARNLMTQFWPYGDNGLSMQNPYWVTQQDLFPNKKERYITNLGLRYNINNWLNISGRLKLDKDNEKAEKRFAASTNTLFASNNGYYSLNSLDTRQIYGDVLLGVNKTWESKYSVSANLGGSIEDVVNNQYLYGGKLLGVANLYTYANVDRTTADMSQTGYHKQKQSAFGNAQFGYENMVFLDVSARNDWASTLAESGSESFFYPSVGLSGILTDIFRGIRSDKLTFLKVRASYSQVGNEPDPFLTIPTYALSGGYPVTQTVLPNPNLKAELTKSLEAGLDVILFKGALKINATAYNSRTYNQFFQPTLSSASGYTSVIVNAGRVDNKGIEATVRYTHDFGKLNWSSYLTYSLNRNKIVQLLPGWTNPITGEVVSLHSLDMSGTGSYKMTLKEGGSMGDIYVNTLRVDEHGAIYVDPASHDVVAEPNTFVYAGNNNPLYTTGWGNDFKWKGISLSFLFTARVGGIVVSNTQAIMDAFGVSKASADARDQGGAIVNGYPVPAKDYYSVVGAGGSGGIASMYCYDATNVRLAELSLGYAIPVKKWNKYIKGANISLIGHNLFLLYNKAPFDPELTANTQTYFQGIDYFMMPSLRSMGFALKLNF